MDFYTEDIVSRKKIGKDYFYITGVVFLALVVFYLGLCFAQYIGSLFLLFTVGVGYGAYFLIRRTNIEFEYILTNGELDIDRIVAKRKRKRIITVDAKQFDFFAPLSNADAKNVSSSSIQQTIHAEGEIGSDKVYVAVLTHKGIKTCLYVQPTEKILAGLEKFIPRRNFFQS